MRAGLRYNRRDFLGAGLGACACGICGRANAQALKYGLEAVEVASGSWAVFGAREYFTTANGGNIVNTAFIEVPDGVVVVDTGPSRRYGEELLALIEQTIPGKPVLRVFNSHHHPDHFLGNQAFDRKLIAAPQRVIDNIAAEGDGFTDNMYRLVGDWMRGTAAVKPGLVIEGDGEEIGGREFGYLQLSGHTSADFAVLDRKTGVLFAGDLAFLDRAPTTPHADIAVWRSSIMKLQATDRALLFPGHGPADAGAEALEQTLDYLDWLDGTLRDSVRRGLTMNEAMQLEIPARFVAIGAIRDEFVRSVVHLYPALETELFETVTVER